MEISLKYIGKPACIVELTIDSFNGSVSEDIADRDGKIDMHFIQSLRDIADELEEQNNSIDNLKNN